MKRTIELLEEQVLQLGRIASLEHRAVDEIVRAAVEGYLARRTRDWSMRRRRFDELVARVREHLPTDAKPEEIEADTMRAREEVRADIRG